MTVRDPVVTMVSLPRFLAPGDNAQIGVVVNNLEGAPGDYRLTLSATGAGALRDADRAGRSRSRTRAKFFRQLPPLGDRRSAISR